MGDTTKCDNCLKDIPAANAALHMGFCVRNVKRCPDCGEVMRKDELERHHSENHAQVTCECGAAMEARELPEHMHEKCQLREVHCEFCELSHPALDLADHQEQCGARTEMCYKCNRYIKLRDFAQHEITNCQHPPASTRTRSNSAEAEMQLDQLRASVHGFMSGMPAAGLVPVPRWPSVLHENGVGYQGPRGQHGGIDAYPGGEDEDDDLQHARAMSIDQSGPRADTGESLLAPAVTEQLLGGGGGGGGGGYDFNSQSMSCPLCNSICADYEVLQVHMLTECPHQQHHDHVDGSESSGGGAREVIDTTEQSTDEGAGQDVTLLPCEICGTPVHSAALMDHQRRCAALHSLRPKALAPQQQPPPPSSQPAGRLPPHQDHPPPPVTSNRMEPIDLDEELLPCELCGSLFGVSEFLDHQNECMGPTEHNIDLVSVTAHANRNALEVAGANGPGPLSASTPAARRLAETLARIARPPTSLNSPPSQSSRRNSSSSSQRSSDERERHHSGAVHDRLGVTVFGTKRSAPASKPSSSDDMDMSVPSHPVTQPARSPFPRVGSKPSGPRHVSAVTTGSGGGGAATSSEDGNVTDEDVVQSERGAAAGQSECGADRPHHRSAFGLSVFGAPIRGRPRGDTSSGRHRTTMGNGRVTGAATNQRRGSSDRDREKSSE